MNHKVIRITTINGIECCSICGQPATRTQADGAETPIHKAEQQQALQKAFDATPEELAKAAVKHAKLAEEKL